MATFSDNDSDVWDGFHFDDSESKLCPKNIKKRTLLNKNAKKKKRIKLVKNLKNDSKRKRTSSSLVTDDEMRSVVNEVEKINNELETKAEKNKLSVLNVKSILNAVIKDEGVKEMVRQTLNPKETSSCTYEPKLTRSKFRELAQSQLQQVSPLLLIKNPIPTSECLSLITEEFPEDEEDEDYLPDDDKSNYEEDRTDLKTTTVEKAKNLDENCSDIALENQSNKEGDEEDIRYVTRSKSLLKDTSLESIEHSFLFPDITTDMYDYECDNTEWANFLKEYTQPPPVNAAVETCDDPDDDPEYNVLADEEQDVIDDEELRADKAVKVSRKEMNELIAELLSFETVPVTQHTELLSYNNGIESVKNVESNIVPFDAADISGMIKNKPDTSEQSTTISNDELPVLTQSQTLLLQQQIRQHIQFSLQHFMQCYKHPLLFSYADKFKSLIQEFNNQSHENINSVFYSLNLKSATCLINNWEVYLRNEQFISFCKDVQNNKTFFPPMMEIMVKNEAFLYPLLLPSVPFLSEVTDISKTLDLSVSEQRLISIGLEEFGKHVSKTYPSLKKNKYYREVVRLISTYLIPVKTAFWLENYIKRKRMSRRNNPIKHYFRHRKSPLIKNYIVPLKIQPLFSQPLQLIPYSWRPFIRNYRSRYGLNSNY